MSRPRCCGGRFCYWRLPFGPWACSECDRQWPATDVPAAHRWLFWVAVDDLVRRMDDFLRTADPRLLAPLELFRRGR